MQVFKDIADLDVNIKKLLYMCNSRPVFHPELLMSDGTDNYRSPSSCEAGDMVALRLRTGKFNVDRAYLVIDNEEILMSKSKTDEWFDYYETSIKVKETTIYYYFKVVTAHNSFYYYNQIGPSRDVNPYYNFEIIPGFKVPEWAKGAVMYQIFVDRFYDADKSNNVLNREYAYIGDHVNHVDDWYQNPARMGIREFYGGDLEGVYEKLDYLSNLGVDVIYFNPLFVSPSNHKYDIQDYDHIDPHYGKIVRDGGKVLDELDFNNSHASKYISRVTDPKNLEASNEYFAKLVEEIHKRGMKVIIDGVFNHCGSFNKWLDREHLYSASNSEYDDGAYESYDSPYHDFFKFYSDIWPNNGSYDGWWGHDTLPKLNYEGSSKLEDYILKIGEKWVSAPYNCDGWRLDVAADLGNGEEYNHKFWAKFRERVKAANPNAIILAEHYGDSKAWLSGGQWDTVMNYDAFMEPITWFLTGMEKHSDEFREDMMGNPAYFWGAMRHNMSRMGSLPVSVSMNELSNHDHSRFLTRTNHTVGRTATLGPEKADEGVDKRVFMEAVVMQMTWPGAPTVYYGDEAGLCGWTDPDNRRTYPWGREDLNLIGFHKEIIKVHKAHDVFKNGSLIELLSDKDFLSYGRFTDTEAAIIIINNSDDERREKIPVKLTGVDKNVDFEQLFVTYDNIYSSAPLWYSQNDGYVEIGIRAHSALILKNM